jgi:tetratricopeptide (TPR) repeat protein
MTRFSALKMHSLAILITFCMITFIFLALPKAEAQSLSIIQIQRMFLEGRYDKTVYEATRLIEVRSSQSDELYYFKGLAQLKLSKFKDARDSFDKIISKFPTSKKVSDAYIGIGDSYFLEGDTNYAIKSYNNALSVRSNDNNEPTVYYRLGMCYKKAGLIDKSEYYFNQVKSAAPLSFETQMISSHRSINIPSEFIASNQAVDTVPSSSLTGAKDYYSVQAGSFRDKKNADRLVQKLSSEGCDSYIETSSTGGNKIYRVRIGRYSRRSDAEALESRLNRNGYSTRLCSNDACQ